MRPDSLPWSRASAPIWALASGYASRVRRDKPMAFLQAFTDDSASEIGDRRLFMAGYLNRAEKWALFSDAWDEELRGTPSIEYFKTSEAYQFEGQFKGWKEDARDEKMRGLVRVIRHFKPLSFEFSVNREQHSRLLKPISPRGFSPYFDCVFGVVASVTRYVASQGGNIPIDFIFDQQDGVSADISLAFDEMIKSLPRKARRLISGTPVFKNDKLVLPLQAADMLAGHIRREYEACPPPARLPMADLLRNSDGHLMSGIEEEHIVGLAEKFGKIPGMPVAQTKVQWRNLRRDMVRLKSLGYIPPYGTHWKNAVHNARERIAKLLSR